MTTPFALAVRAVACSKWQWMPGMVVMYNFGGPARDRYLCTDRLGVNLVVVAPGSREGGPLAWITTSQERFDRDRLPDLDDPGTLGYLEHGLLPELYGCEIWLEFSEGWWRVRGHTYPGTFGGGATKAEALVSALESISAE